MEKPPRLTVGLLEGLQSHFCEERRRSVTSRVKLPRTNGKFVVLLPRLTGLGRMHHGNKQ